MRSRCLRWFPYSFFCWAALGMGLLACSPSGSSNNQTGEQGPCTGTGFRCSNNVYQQCVNGSWSDSEACGSQVCDPLAGCTSCESEYTCIGDNIHACQDDGGVGEMVNSCPAGSCKSGQCIDPCGAAAKAKSYIGCEYYAVDLDNAIQVQITSGFLGCAAAGEGLVDLETPDGVCHNPDAGVFEPKTAGFCDPGNVCPDEFDCDFDVKTCGFDAQHGPFAVVVSNPDQVNTVDVTIENSAGMKQVSTVGPGAVVALYPQELGFADQSIDKSSIRAAAYHITSTRPVVAYQFNPLDNENVFSNDGSLLIPVYTYGKEYFAISKETSEFRPRHHNFHGSMTVLASATGTTEVTVTPAATVMEGDGVESIPAGTQKTFTLQQYQVLNLQAAVNGDLTGSKIVSTQPVGVFGGHEAINISPGNNKCCADHLEDQLFPSNTWGKLYAVARSQVRDKDKDLLRIVAQKAGTTVSFNPSTGLSCGTLGIGEYCDVWINADVEITATQPIMVGHYLSSVGGGTFWDPKPAKGDPSLSMLVPTEQFRTEYTFLVPKEYDENFVSIVATLGDNVKLDGLDVGAQLNAFGSGSYAGARLPVVPGQHRISCLNKCSIEVHGYSTAVSYLFAGGLDLDTLVVE